MDEIKKVSPESHHEITLSVNSFPISSETPTDKKPPQTLPKPSTSLKKREYIDYELMQELQKKFQNSLTRLALTETRERALEEAKCLIERNNSAEALKIYIGSLSEHMRSKSHSARELEVFLLGYLSQVYKERLIEESVPLRQLVRIAEIIQTYFKDLNKKVQEAAAEALCSLYKHSLPKVSQQIVFSFMFEPLNSILTSGIDVQAQHSACITIFKWAELLVQEKDRISLLTLYNRTLTLFLKLRAEFLELISALGLMIEKCGFQPVIDSLHLLLNKLLMYLKHPSSTSQLLKLESCKLLGFIGKHLSSTGFLELDRVPAETLTALRELRTEKMPLLQSMARDTLKIWEKYQVFLTTSHDLSAQNANYKENNISAYFNKAIKKNQDPVMHFRVIKNLIEINKEKSKTVEIPESEDSSNWGLKNKGFLKRGTGNYSVVTAQGLINIEKALEKRPSVKEFLQKKPYQANRRSVEILYKENSEVNIYDRRKSKIFEVQDPQMACMFVPTRNHSRPEHQKDKDIENENPINLYNSNELLMVKKSQHLAIEHLIVNSKKNLQLPIRSGKSTPRSLRSPSERSFISSEENAVSGRSSRASNIEKYKLTAVNEVEKETRVNDRAKNEEYLLRPRSSKLHLKLMPKPEDEEMTFDEKKPLDDGIENKFVTKEMNESIYSMKLNQGREKNDQRISQRNSREIMLRKKSVIAIPKTQEILNYKDGQMDCKKIEDITVKTNLSSKETAGTNEKNKIKEIPSENKTVFFKFPPQLEMKKAQNIEIKPKYSKENILIIPEDKLHIDHQLNCMVQRARIPTSAKNNRFLENSFYLDQQSKKLHKVNSSKEIQTSLASNHSYNSSKARPPTLKKPINNYHSKATSLITNTDAVKFQVLKIEEVINEKFEVMVQELRRIEDRLELAHETISTLHKHPSPPVPNKKSSSLPQNHCKFTQTSEKSGTDPHQPRVLRNNLSLGTDLLQKIQAPINLQRIPQRFDPLTQCWVDTLQLVYEGKLSEAFESILRTGDDLYLLRLMHHTQPCLDDLEKETALKVLEKLTCIMQSRFIEIFEFSI